LADVRRVNVLDQALGHETMIQKGGSGVAEQKKGLAKPETPAVG